ncbi:discoidin domain-containing protein [Clostridium sp. SHJSY1]|uniref:discoidin domain-containing protein n=1 Tax=Clostridium sp. SHJSY1 TaxID=2942483 RepID=UPI0028749C2F|nr:discoidin domain-containing protein [Clostridium sp. SHJSY1]MDS0527543.1 discoidin domain-containing protein [Clostridium sp. SHJSY1]
MLKRKVIFSISLSLAVASSLMMVGNNVFAKTLSSTGSTSFATTTLNASKTSLTLSDMPSNLKSSIEWVWNNRMIKEGSTTRKNLIFDQIYAGKGTLNYVVRWQSNKNLTLEQRKKFETMLNRQVNNWVKKLKGYDGWAYDSVTVKVVGWACANASQILDKQPNETVYTNCINDDLNKTNPSIPAKLPSAPTNLSRADHFEDKNYSYPGGYDKRFDMYLWGTTNFEGGAGGDWGQRISDDYILSMLDTNEAHIIEHEMGHGFGMPDFYEDNDRPPGGFPTPTIMWAGNSATITDWDSWLLRYTWSQLKKDTSRFPATSTTPTNSNIALKASATTSYCSSWENISALNDGVDPSNSNDRNHAVYGNWPQTGTQWVQYDFDKNYNISSCDLYWFKDNQGVDVPKSYKIKYWNGSAWIEVSKPVGLGTAINKYNTTTFTTVNTKSIRVEMVSKGTASTGLLEWKVSGAN